MKTRQQWFDTLPKTIRDKAVEYTTYYKGFGAYDCLNEECESLLRAVTGDENDMPFKWYNTPEGGDYWLDVAEGQFPEEAKNTNIDEILNGSDEKLKAKLEEAAQNLLFDSTLESRQLSNIEQVAENFGIKESSGKLSYELDWEFIKSMAERMEKNKGKYPPYQWWHKKMNLEDMINGLKRHSVEIFMGEFEDDGEPLGHLDAIACNAMMIKRQLLNFGK